MDEIVDLKGGRSRFSTISLLLRFVSLLSSTDFKIESLLIEDSRTSFGA
jgi:hypothetical protein